MFFSKVFKRTCIDLRNIITLENQFNLINRGVTGQISFFLLYYITNFVENQLKYLHPSFLKNYI